MWKDAEGNIVTKKPSLGQDQSLSQGSPDPFDASLPDFVSFQHEQTIPISPPISHDPSLGPSSLDDHDSGFGSGYPPTLDAQALSGSDSFSPGGQRFWSNDLSQPVPEPFPATALDDAPFEDIFNPDTASSFNNPFTTMNNYTWLFDLDLSKQAQLQPASLVTDPFTDFQFNTNVVTQPSHAFNLALDHITVEKDFSIAAQHGSLPSQRIDSPQESSVSAPLISPPLTDEETIAIEKPSLLSGATHAVLGNADPLGPTQLSNSSKVAPNIEKPLSMLHPSRSLPIIDELARQQVLDLIDITQPTAPDGSLVMRDHPLLSLSCLQTYCDLFFTRFNTTYPLIHMSTFDPSHVDTLLLASVLLLGATYGEKDAHQLAVCIHDVLRPQIFANAGFSAKPELWVLQTILLVECFGKSRAGQKQHDMSHLFHGLLINLIRRSDCQSIKPPTLAEATDDLEDDWRTWVDAEQKKRLAFLCFMWDTQHAVLFCQSLCMSAFELRSTLPCSQAVWEAPNAESWHHLRKKSSAPPPLFLSCLKMYLNPTTGSTSIPKDLNALSRSLLLHGLMSVAWDMQRRDQTALGVVDTTPLSNWQARLASSYSAWHTDFTSFCASYHAGLPVCSHSHALAREFAAWSTATLSLYHAAHILLHTPFLDLQIYAGARHILGKPVARTDYGRSQRVVKKWVAEHSSAAARAVWHAAKLVQDGVEMLDAESGSEIGGGGRLWHLPWAVYLGTLVVWGVWYARPAPTPVSASSSSTSGGQGGSVGADAWLGYGEDDDDEIIWDPNAEMQGLLEIILRCEPAERLVDRGVIGGGVGKRGTNGLAAVVSRCLSKVRWAVVHDGMMVLRGLVCWRLVGGGGMA
ncbi:hypothetical protein K491DRAFT_707764 [Lophiostoma macrostomum CBS 122681]|uniref:Xylanolytic transcriptional activator regulatory domain-containing protein n=1 Tax=Lophiostoma macrostomum CBS 122681 TaxID=1314788 RepID=A0A6A6SUF0_9PLEO|nr:hypothetical protein K491DRAFT_707764 [Lophiostoma macrostomum CBS 122681]